MKKCKENTVRDLNIQWDIYNVFIPKIQQIFHSNTNSLGKNGHKIYD